MQQNRNQDSKPTEPSEARMEKKKKKKQKKKMVNKLSIEWVTLS